MKRFLLCLLLTLPLFAEHWVDTPRPGVVVLRSEKGNFPGCNTKGVLPMGAPAIVAKKQLDLTVLPAGALDNAKKVSLRMFIGIVDWDMGKPNSPNHGLKQHFAITINGHAMNFCTNDVRFPTTDNPRKPRRQEWMELPFPLEWIKGTKTMEITLQMTDQGDDMLYPGIDNTVPTVASWVSFNKGKKFIQGWHDTKGQGEFMFRLILSSQAERENVT